uniref:Uncharacterized protein n=1 Tax=Ditylenchus dipsaci TaxID=166011 RepID=A0A915CSL1_9BILA
MKAISFSTDWSNQNQENRLLESRCTSLAELHRCQRLAKSSLFLKLETSRNHIRKLLTGDGAMKISAVLPDTTSRVMFEKIFSVMGKIQAYSKASFLDIEEIDEFKNLVIKFFSCFKLSLGESAIPFDNSRISSALRAC